MGGSANNFIRAIHGIRIGSNVWVGPGVVIVDADHNVSDFDKPTKDDPIEIGNNVWIGAHSVILPGSRIGNNVVIGAGSVVHKAIPDNSIAVGNPCKVVKTKEPYVGFPWDGRKYPMQWHTIDAVKKLIIMIRTKRRDKMKT